MQLIKKVLLGVILVSITQTSFAVCKRLKTTPERVPVNFGTIIVPSNLKTGDVIAQTTTSRLNKSYYYDGCSDSKQYLDGSYVGYTQGTGNYDTIPTGVKGIGVRIAFTVNNTSDYFGKMNLRAIIYPSLNGGSRKEWITLDSATITVQLIKTDNEVGGGSLSDLSGVKGELYLSGRQGKDAPMVIIELGGASGTAVVNPSCRVDSNNGRDLDVTLHTVPLSGFNGIGSTSGDTNFNFTLKCSGGDDKNVLNVKTHFSVASEAPVDAAKGILANGAKTTSAAKDIGVQVMLNGKPISFEERYQMGKLGSNEQTLTLPMSARYYQYGNNATGGKVESHMTYNIDYD